jgi:O-methyltransferase involved in polyketide biosynthesis
MMPLHSATANRYDSAAVSLTNPIRNISDTALWVAVYRAQESERADAVFRDPYARKLAGDRGTQIAAAMPFAQRHSWSYTARTWLVDQVIEREVQQGADMVVNLAAGLDSRPYRMQLPASLRWIEIDLPDMLTYKQEVLAAERPLCTPRARAAGFERYCRAPGIVSAARGRSEARAGGERRAHHLL